MPLASFHYAFHSRDEMIRELVAFVVDNERLAAMASLRPSLDARSTIRAGIQAYFDLVVSEPGREQAMFELFHYSLRTAQLEDLARVQYTSYHSIVAEVLLAGAEHANIQWSIPMADLARLTVAFTDGLTLSWLADRDDAAAGRLMDAMTDALVSFALPVPPALPDLAISRPKEHSS